MYNIKLSDKQYKLLAKVVSNKLKEVHMWKVATRKPHQDDTYLMLISLDKAITTSKRVH